MLLWQCAILYGHLYTVIAYLMPYFNYTKLLMLQEKWLLSAFPFERSWKINRNYSLLWYHFDSGRTCYLCCAENRYGIRGIACLAMESVKSFWDTFIKRATLFYNSMKVHFLNTPISVLWKQKCKIQKSKRQPWNMVILPETFD